MRLEARAQLLKRQLAVLVFVENLEPLVGGAQPLVEGDVGVEVVVGSGDRLRLANQLLDAPRRGSASPLDAGLGVAILGFAVLRRRPRTIAPIVATTARPSAAR